MSSESEIASELRAPLAHGEVLAGLWRSAADGRLPHALLLRGPEGIGKFLAENPSWAGFSDVSLDDGELRARAEVRSYAPRGPGYGYRVAADPPSDSV